MPNLGYHGGLKGRGVVRIGGKAPGRKVIAPAAKAAPVIRTTIWTAAGRRYVLSNSPTEAQLGGSAMKWAEVDRPGREPLLVRDALETPTLSFTHFELGTTASLDITMNAYRALSRAGLPVRLTGASQPEMTGWWIIDSLSIEVVQRMTNQRASAARVSWSFKRYTPTSAELGRADAPAAAPRPGGSAPSSPGGRPASSTSTYTVKSGDSLWAIASAKLGDGSRYPEIARLNGITNPNAISVGQVLKIPAK